MSRQNKWLRGCKRASMELKRSVSSFDYLFDCISVPWAVLSSYDHVTTYFPVFWECSLKRTNFQKDIQGSFFSLLQDPAVPGGLNAWSYAQSRGKAMYTTVCLSICYMQYFSDSFGHGQFGQQIMYTGVSQQGRG